jgi:uncharacterized membrane protein
VALAVASSVPREPINTGFIVGKLFAVAVIAPSSDAAVAMCVTVAVAELARSPSGASKTGKICGIVVAVEFIDPSDAVDEAVWLTTEMLELVNPPKAPDAETTTTGVDAMLALRPLRLAELLAN